VEILALTHEPGPCSGVFADVAAERGDTLEEWSLAWGTPPPRPLDEYEAVFAFGGVMNTHEEHYHPWLREENLLIQRFLDQGVPFLGICLGGQLLAKAAHTPVTKAVEPEIGWFPVELMEASAADPVFSTLPRRFMAYQWHHYRFDLPGGAVPLARSRVCLQAFRLGEIAWGLQFHCEVTREMVFQWTADFEADRNADRGGYDGERMRSDTGLHIEEWNAIGREISGRFLTTADRVGKRLSAV
jgi:GMP synthase-like glutamine amidotransferase